MTLAEKQLMFSNVKEEPNFVLREYHIIFPHGQSSVIQASASNLLLLNMINIFWAIIYPL